MNIWNENLNQMKSFYIFCNVTTKKKTNQNKNQTETLSPVFLLKRLSLDRITVLPEQVLWNCLNFHTWVGLAPVVQKVDDAIHWINL